MTPKQQADGEIHEDQLLNFLVNTLTGAFSLSLGDNAEIDAVLADRGFWQERVVRRAREIGAVAIPVIPKRGCLSKKLDTHQSYWSEYTMYEGRERELTFPLAVCVS